MDPRIVSREEWLDARKAHLKSEKALTRMHDLVMVERRRLPWVRVEKDYSFQTTAGEKSLAELFDGRRQLIVYHFMFGPGWKKGCTGCSFIWRLGAFKHRRASWALMIMGARS